MFPNLSINKKILNLIFIFSLCTLSFRCFDFFGYAIPFSAVPLLLYILPLGQTNRIFNIVFGTVTLYFIALFLFYFDQSSPLEFFKTFLLALATLLVFLCSFYSSRSTCLNLELLTVVKYSILAIVFFELLQLFELAILNQTKLWFIFDPISTSTATDPKRFSAIFNPDYIRPISFFHEPGYMATILLVLLIMGRNLGLSLLQSVICCVGIFLSFSAGAIIFTLTYYLGCLFFKSRKYFFVLLCCLLILILLKATDLVTFFRLNEIVLHGTSGYIRLTEPFVETLRLLFLFPLGIPLGQNTYAFNNSFFLLISYFGFFSIAVYGGIVLGILKRIKLNINRFAYLIALLSILFCNGSFFTLTTVFLLLLINLVFLRSHFDG